MKTHLVCSVTVSAKKGDTQTARFVINQDIPWPRVHTSGGSLEWQNHEGKLFSHCGQGPKGIRENYTCELLSMDFIGELPDNYNRMSLAGFSHRPGPYGTPEITNPSLVYRGKSLGELTISFGNNLDWPDIKQGYSGSFTSVERGWIKEQIVPQLRAFIAANKAELRKMALAAIESRMRENVAEKRAELDRCEALIDEAMKNA